MHSSDFLWRPSPPSLSVCAVQLELTPPPLHDKHVTRTQQIHTPPPLCSRDNWFRGGHATQDHAKVNSLMTSTSEASKETLSSCWNFRWTYSWYWSSSMGWLPGTHRSVESEATPRRAQQEPWLSSLLNFTCKWTFGLPLRERCLPRVPKGPSLCQGPGNSSLWAKKWKYISGY